VFTIPTIFLTAENKLNRFLCSPAKQKVSDPSEKYKCEWVIRVVLEDFGIFFKREISLTIKITTLFGS
jgi:hypothetical protein